MQIRVEHLTKRYGDSLALQDVNLTVEDGELFFLLGPSGCGKTTLLRTIAGFESPTRGEIYLGDAPQTGIPPARRNAAMVFQGYALWPHLTVRENVSFGLEMQGISREEREERVTRTLRELQILELAERKPNQLSGGQQQRVALARTLVIHPGVLLLDEPLANLDAKLRRDMRLEIRRICKENHLTGIYVTHDRAEALSMADRLAVLRGGRLEQVGTPREVYRRPRTPFVAEFIGETNLREATLREIREEGALLDTPLGPLLSRSLPPEAAPGMRLVLSLRPEAFRLLSPQDAPRKTENTVSVTLKMSEYLGEICQYEALDATGSPLRFDQLNPGDDGLVPGQSLRLALSPLDVVCMKP